jgi:ATP-dependent protease ClpP protease subunit
MSNKFLSFGFGMLIFVWLLLIVKAQGNEPNVLVLSDKNTVSLHLPITDSSVTKVQLELLKKSNSLKKNSEIFLVLNSPGGDMDAADSLVRFAKGLPQKVNTVSLFSASISFIISQRLNTRYVTESSVLMSHRTVVSGIVGEVPGSFISKVNVMLQSIFELEEEVATRGGYSLSTYRKLIADQLWMNGKSAIRLGFADKLVTLRCDKSLSGRGPEEITDFGSAKAILIFHKCPLITIPEQVKVNGQFTTSSGYEVKNAFFKSLYDKPAFVRDYIENGRITTITK